MPSSANRSIESRLRIRSSIALLCVLLSVVARGQEPGEPGSTPEANASETRDLEISLRAEIFGNGISDSASFVLETRNLSDKSFDIGSASLRAPDAFRRVRPARTDWGFECPTKQIGSKQTVRCYLSVESVSPADLGDLLSPDAVFFWPGEYPIQALLKYRQAISDTPWVFEQVETRVPLSPSLSAVIGGGCLGSLLWILYLGAARLGERLKTEPVAAVLGWKSALRSGIQIVAEAVVVSLVATIVIVLLHAGADLELPIQLRVRDWIGGMIVGFSSVRLERALRERFL